MRASQPRVAGRGFSKKDGGVIPAHAGIQDSCDRGKRHWAPVPAFARTGSSRGRRFIGSRAFCFLRASQPRAAGQVFSKKHGVVIPAHAGIQDSCDRGKRHWAPAYAGATIDGVAIVLFLESFSAPRRGAGVLEETWGRHPRACGDPVIWPLLQVRSGPPSPPSRGQALRGGDEPGVAGRCLGRIFTPCCREGDPIRSTTYDSVS